MCWAYLMRCPTCLKNELYWINCNKGRGDNQSCERGRTGSDGHEVEPASGIRNAPWTYWGRENWCKVKCVHCKGWMYYFEEESRVKRLRKMDVNVPARRSPEVEVKEEEVESEEVEKE